MINAKSALMQLCAIFFLTLTATNDAGAKDIVQKLDMSIEASSGFMHPAIKFAFNPQPDPPGEPIVDLSDPQHPLCSWSNTTHQYQIVFGISEPGLNFFISTPQSMPFNNMYAFSYEAVDNLGASSFFDVYFDISTVGTFDAASWVAFNPQPDAPYELVGFQFDVIPASPTSVSIGVQIINRETGSVGLFRAVPEPNSLMPFGIVAALCTLRRIRRRYHER